MLTGWWTRLETAPWLSGPRRHLQELLGENAVDFFEQAGILRHDGAALRYPCRERAGGGCPRDLIEIDGAYCAVCGNRPKGCDDLELGAGDVALLTVNLLRLCRTVAVPLGIRGSPEVVADLADVVRVGAIVPEVGLRYPVFLVIRPTPDSYCEVVGALSARSHGTPFGALMPTDRFVTDCVERIAHDVRATIITLDGALSICRDGFAAAPRARELLAGIGTTTVRTGDGTAAPIVARALICDGGSPPAWRDLDEEQYGALCTATDAYSVFADERQRRVCGRHAPPGPVPTSYFRMIRSVVTSRTRFDPNAMETEFDSAKQIFQRARKVFDPGSRGSGWRIIKSVKGDENRAFYVCQPDPGVSFAYIFLPDR